MLLISISSVCVIPANDTTVVNGSFTIQEPEFSEWSKCWKIGLTSEYDINLDMCVSPADLSGVASHYMESGKPGWITADVNKNGIVGPEDMSGVAAHYMEEY